MCVAVPRRRGTSEPSPDEGPPMADRDDDEAAVTSEVFGLIRAAKASVAECLASGATPADVRAVFLYRLEEWLATMPAHLHGRFRAAVGRALDEALPEIAEV